MSSQNTQQRPEWGGENWGYYQPIPATFYSAFNGEGEVNSQILPGSNTSTRAGQLQPLDVQQYTHSPYHQERARVDLDGFDSYMSYPTRDPPSGPANFYPRTSQHLNYPGPSILPDMQPDLFVSPTNVSTTARLPEPMYGSAQHSGLVRAVGTEATLQASMVRRRKGIPAPYLCSYCNRTFTVRRNLNYHINAHFGVKEYMCSECHMPISTRSDVKRHAKTQHPERAKLVTPIPNTEARPHYQ